MSARKHKPSLAQHVKVLNAHFGEKKNPTPPKESPTLYRFLPCQPSDPLEAFTIRLVFAVILVRRRVQEHQGEDIEVPHPVDAGEEGAVHLYCHIPPLPEAFGHLPRRKQRHRGPSVRPNSGQRQKGPLKH